MAWLPSRGSSGGMTLATACSLAFLLVSLASSTLAQESSGTEEAAADGTIECWFCGPDHVCPLNWRDSVDGGGNVTVEKIRCVNFNFCP